MALGGSQTQQPTKNRVMTGGGRLPVGVSCSLGRPPLILGGERKRRGEERRKTVTSRLGTQGWTANKSGGGAQPNCNPIPLPSDKP
jgi:hypothetical protein